VFLALYGNSSQSCYIVCHEIAEHYLTLEKSKHVLHWVGLYSITYSGVIEGWVNTVATTCHFSLTVMQKGGQAEAELAVVAW